MNNLNKDILLGTAIGDALGLPVQFLEREVVAKNPITTKDSISLIYQQVHGLIILLYPFV